ncbi:hypothetical protein F7725_017320 [Dissostichus mawsoni]|uniref:Uncharacterized protein n=1 Tax=Dissostichus mawsoni TaxID=36200 RepID=A0A7J5Z7A5_DISMA|nr:hypothetical protein F7725_017320 [Dissostichus mawsoni]
MGGMERRCGGGGGFIDPLFLCFPVLVARLEGTEQAESRVERSKRDGGRWGKSAWLAFVLQMSMLPWPCGYSLPSRLTAYSGQRGCNLKELPQVCPQNAVLRPVNVTQPGALSSSDSTERQRGGKRGKRETEPELELVGFLCSGGLFVKAVLRNPISLSLLIYLSDWQHGPEANQEERCRSVSYKLTEPEVSMPEVCNDTLSGASENHPLRHRAINHADSSNCWCDSLAWHESAPSRPLCLQACWVERRGEELWLQHCHLQSDT